MSFEIFCCYQYLICGCATFFLALTKLPFFKDPDIFQSRNFFVSLNFIVINVQTLKIFYNFVVVYTTFFWNCINAPILLTFKVFQNSVLYTYIYTKQKIYDPVQSLEISLAPNKKICRDMDLFFQQDILSQRLFLSPFVKGIYVLLNWPNLCYLIKVEE